MKNLSLEQIGLIISIIISVVAILQSRKAYNLSQMAQKIDLLNLKNAINDNVSIIKCVGEIKCEYKDVYTLFSQVTFDFDDFIECRNDDEFINYISLTVSIQNIGRGIINRIDIISIGICTGNKTFYDKSMNSRDVKSLVYYDTETSQKLVLGEMEKTDINLLFPFKGFLPLTNNDDDDDNSYEKVNKYLRSNDILVIINLNIYSTNNSSYEQKTLWCNYVEGEAVLCSVDSVNTNLENL